MTEPVRVVTLNRLSPNAYKALEKETRGKLPLVPKTGDESLFTAGVEYVLRALRDGYVVEE